MRGPGWLRYVFGSPARDGGDLGVVGPVRQGLPSLALRQQRPLVGWRELHAGCFGGGCFDGGGCGGGCFDGGGERRDRDGDGDRRGHLAQPCLREVSDQFQRVVEGVAVPPGQVADGGEPVELPGDLPLLAADHGPGTRHPAQLRAAFG
jgi:hypothetical protein